jgi:inorganic pyrophosphatase
LGTREVKQQEKTLKAVITIATVRKGLKYKRQKQTVVKVVHFPLKKEMNYFIFSTAPA